MQSISYTTLTPKLKLSLLPSPANRREKKKGPHHPTKRMHFTRRPNGSPCRSWTINHKEERGRGEGREITAGREKQEEFHERLPLKRPIGWGCPVCNIVGPNKATTMNGPSISTWHGCTNESSMWRPGYTAPPHPYTAALPAYNMQMTTPGFNWLDPEVATATENRCCK